MADLPEIKETSNAFRILSKLRDWITVQFGENNYDSISNSYLLMIKNAVLFLFEEDTLMKLHWDWVMFEYASLKWDGNYIYVSYFSKMNWQILNKEIIPNTSVLDTTLSNSSDSKQCAIIQLKGLHSIRLDVNSFVDLFKNEDDGIDLLSLFMKHRTIVSIDRKSNIKNLDLYSREVSELIELDLTKFNLLLILILKI